LEFTSMRLAAAAVLVVVGAIAGVMVLDAVAQEWLFSPPVLIGGFAALLVLAWALLTPGR
jgi:hypothetical protein